MRGKTKRVDEILYDIRLRYLTRMDAEESEEEEEEEEPKKKKTTGWGTRLPYGLCKGLGIDTTGMTPTEAWEAYENETGKSAKETYKEKEEKGVGEVIDVKEKKEEAGKSSDTLDYSSMSKAELEKKSEEVSKKIMDIFDKYGGPEKVSTEKMSEKDTEEWEKLDSELGKIYDHLYSDKEETDKSSLPVDYSSMTLEELEKEYNELKDEIHDMWFSDEEGLVDFDLLSKADDVAKAIKEKGGEVEPYEWPEEPEEGSYLGPEDSFGIPAGDLPEDWAPDEPFVHDPWDSDLEDDYTDIESETEETSGAEDTPSETKAELEETGAELDYSSMTKEELGEKLSEVSKKITDIFEKYSDKPDSAPMSEEDLSELDKLYDEQNDILENMSDEDIDEYVSGVVGDPEMTKEKFESEIGGTADELLDAGGFYPGFDGYINPLTGELVSEDLGKKYNDLAEKYKTKKEEESDLPFPGFEPLLTKKELEDDYLYGTIEEFEKAGGFIGDKEGGYTHPLTGEECSPGFVKVVNDHLKYYKWYDHTEPEDETTSFSTHEPEEDEDYIEALKKSLEWTNSDIDTFTQNLKDFGFTDEEIEEEDYSKVLRKYDAAKKFYDARRDFDDWNKEYEEKHGEKYNIIHASEEEQAEREKNRLAVVDAVENAIDSGCVFGTSGISGISEEKATAISEKKDMSAYYMGLLKQSKIDKAADEAKLAKLTGESKPTDTATETVLPETHEEPTAVEPEPVPTETVSGETATPKKTRKTLSSLQKEFDKNTAELESLYDKKISAGGGATVSYNDAKAAAESGGVEGVHTVDDLFDRIDKLKALYDAADKKKEWLEAHDGKTPEELLTDGMTAAEYKALYKEYKGLDDGIKSAQDALSKYGKMTFNDDGTPMWISKGKVNSQVAWKENVKPVFDRIKELETANKELAPLIEEKKQASKVRALTKEKTELSKKANELKASLDEVPIKTYSGIWKNDVKTSDYEGLNIEGKRNYYNNQIEKLTGGSSEDMAKVAKFQDYLKQLDELEANGKVYAERKKAYDDAMAEVRKKQDEINKAKSPSVASTTDSAFGPEAYSPERKDHALWAKTRKTADKNLWDVSAQVWKNATTDEKKAIYDYTGSYTKFNGPLRGYKYKGDGFGGYGEYVGPDKIDFDHIGSFGTGVVKKEINDMTDLINKSSYDKDMWLQRGVRMDQYVAQYLGLDLSTLRYGSEKELQDKLLGSEITEHGFSSTGASKGTGFKDKEIIMNIYAPAGTKMMYVEPFSKYGHREKKEYKSGISWDGETHASGLESELEVLIQRGTKFRITRVERGDKLYLDLEIIGQDPRKI